MVEVEIFGLALDDKNKSPIIVLKDEGERAVPIWIGAMEAMAISTAINEVAFPRPMTHDLMVNVIQTMGGKVSRVEITDIEKGTFFAEIVVSTEGSTYRIDCRPSDAIAVAVRTKCPIFMAENVFTEAGAPIQEESEMVIKTEDSDTWADELEKLSEDDTKYKM